MRDMKRSISLAAEESGEVINTSIEVKMRYQVLELKYRQICENVLIHFQIPFYVLKTS